MKKIIALVTLAFLAVPTWATSVDPVSVESLFDQSEIVVSGEIISGRVLSDKCGVEVTIKVEESFKGHYHPDDFLVTSIFQEQATLGTERIFFISRTQDQVTGITSSNSHDMNLMHKNWLRCKSVKPLYTVNLTGMAAPSIAGTYLKDAPKVVQLNEFVIQPPQDLPSRKEERSKAYGFDRYTDHVWIEKSKFFEYLRKLANED